MSILKKISFQAFSDIHIELWNKLPIIPVKAKYLFLAGDICKLNHPLFFPFFNYCSSNWEKVFYTPGNHEFYIENKNYNEINFEYNLKIQQKYKNVYYLNNESVSINDDFDVYGSVFWTHPTFTSTYAAKMCVNDYNFITYFNKDLNKVVNWDINYVKKISQESYELLQNHLDESDKVTIVMTHFPPFNEGTSNPIYKNQNAIVSSYFTWEDKIINKLDLNNIACWISGHTHWSYNIEKKGCKFIANQLGYKYELGKTGINEDGLYEIEFTS